MFNFDNIYEMLNENDANKLKEILENDLVIPFYKHEIYISLNLAKVERASIQEKKTLNV